MKKLLLMLPFILSGCGLFGGDTSTAVQTPTTPRGIYEAAGGNQIHLVQTNAVGTVAATTLTIETVGATTTATIHLDGCYYTQDITNYDSANMDFWALQPITVEYDPTMVYCGNFNCTGTGVSMVGTVAEGTFTCL